MITRGDVGICLPVGSSLQLVSLPNFQSPIKVKPSLPPPFHLTLGIYMYVVSCVTYGYAM